MHAKQKIIALGELLIDFIPAREQMRLQDSGAVIKTASGSAGIFACAAAQLGAQSSFIGKLGKDQLSCMAYEELKAHQVDLSGAVFSDEGQIGLAFVEYTPEGRNYQYYRKNSVGSMLCAEDVNETQIANAFAVHYPGMLLQLTPQMRGACQKMVELARRNGVFVSFDPNIRLELSADPEARACLLEAVRNSDIIAPTLAEGRMITGKDSVGDVLRTLHAMGPRVVALTQDKDGALLSMDGMIAVAEGIDEPSIDPTGAGDAFAAALCVGLQKKMPLAQLASFCNCTGTLVIRKRGAIGMALPTRAEVDAYMSSGVCHVHVESLEHYNK